MKTYKQFIKERKEEDVDQGDISRFIQSMEMLISRRKHKYTVAVDVWHDYVLKGNIIDWLQPNVVPIWEKHGFPLPGEKAWGRLEKEVIKILTAGGPTVF